MTRIDRQGRDVTDLPGLWSESDLEITTTQYRHPNDPPGQHVNGPAKIFYRFIGRDWMLSEHKSMHNVVRDFTLGKLYEVRG